MGDSRTLGCLVRSGPFEGCSGRDQLDLVMAALLNGWQVELCFAGAGVLHLLANKDHESARLPGTWKGWAGLPELGTVRAWVDRESTGLEMDGNHTLLPFAECDRVSMAERLAGCDRVCVIG